MPEQPTILSRGFVSKAVVDDAFYTALPEFIPLKAKLKAMHIDPKTRGGCRGCRERRIEQSLMKDFLSTMRMLDDNGIERLKRYFGVGKMMYNTHNPKTGEYELKII